MNITDKGTQQR